MKEYKTFEDWFYQMEGFSLRAERFYEDLDNKLDREEMLEWLKACWESAREEK